MKKVERGEDGNMGPMIEEGGIMVEEGMTAEEASMTRVEFKFMLNQRVETPFGEQGMIQMMGIDDGGKKCFVITSCNETWFNEAELKKWTQ